MNDFIVDYLLMQKQKFQLSSYVRVEVWLCEVEKRGYIGNYLYIDILRIIDIFA